MSRNNQSDDSNNGSNEQLPRPQIALKEKTDERERCAYDATYGLGPEAQDDTRNEATKAYDDTLKGAIEHLEDACKTHRRSTNTTDEAHEYPHV